MPVILCCQDSALQEKVDEFAQVLKTEAHKLGTHGLSENEFYRVGIFQGAIQQIRGEISATMVEKRSFMKAIFDYMQDRDFITDWSSSGDANRHDYAVTLPNGRISVVETKGCLDGNNTTIFERPDHASEFIIWSLCSNPAADPRHNVWSGIHTRLGAEIIQEKTPVDGLVVWDWLCGTLGRPCPKLARADGRLTTVGPYQLPPPCIYLFPPTIPSVRTNPSPEPNSLEDVGLLHALHQCFGGLEDEINLVRFEVAYRGKDVVRTTTVERAGTVQHQSNRIAIRRK